MSENKQACTQRRVDVSRNDLPLSCPLPDMTLWNSHPRVYLDITTHGEVICPYCSTLFVLKK